MSDPKPPSPKPPTSGPLQPSGPAQTSGPAQPTGDFGLDIDEDLLAQALAAVESRSRGPAPDEMAEFADDLDVLDPTEEIAISVAAPRADASPRHASAPGDELPGDELPGDELPGDELPGDELPGDELIDYPTALAPDADLDDIILDLGDDASPPPPDAPPPPDQPLDFATLASDWEHLNARLERHHARILTLKQQLDTLTREHRRALARLHDQRARADRAEARAEFQREARVNAEEQVRRLQNTVSQQESDRRQMQLRRQREQAAHRKHGHAPVILELLPILDHLEMALSHAHTDSRQVVDGLQMIVGQFHATLERLGVERVATAPGTPFQPEDHDAFMEVPSEDHPPGSIVAELTPGYRLRGRLLRAARVSVAAPPAAARWEDPEEQPHEPHLEPASGEE